MKRRDFLTRAGLAGAGMGLVPLSFADAEGTAHGNRARPNIIFLLTDDQRWDMMGCAGNPWIQTPNMDALAHDGCRFTNAFVTTSICAASRASFLTGLYERTHRFTFGTPPLAERFVDMSYPVRLRAAGYRTALFGKFGIQVPHGATSRMFGDFANLTRHPYFKKQADGSERHLTDLLADRAIGFLRSARSGKQPFCLSISFNAPHAEDSDPRQYIWPRAMDGLYRDVTFPPPPDSDPAFFAKLPAFLQKSLNRERWHWRFDTPEKRQEMTRGYYRMISGVDAVVGRVRRELRGLGLADNTVLVLMGDNGYFLGERGFAGKWLGYEPSLRVPLLVFDPRTPQPLRGRTVSAMALDVDIAPTLLDLAGARVPALMQGRSLGPLLANRPVIWRSDFFCEHLFNHPKIPKYEGVRTLRWKYLRYFEHVPVYEELYDLAKDPLEEHNLVADSRYAMELDRLRKRCDQLRDQYGGPYRPPIRKERAPAFRATPTRYVEGVKGRAAWFDGHSFLECGTVPALPRNGKFSWSFWTWIDRKCPHSGVLVGNRRAGTGKDRRCFMKVTRDSVQFFSGPSHSIKLALALPEQHWVHIVAVRDGPKLTCWVDGRPVAQGKVSFDMPELPLYLGGDPRAREMAVCRLDEVRWYTRSLTGAEIQALHHLRPVPSGMTGCRTFDDRT